jgi:hypothetical protein
MFNYNYKYSFLPTSRILQFVLDPRGIFHPPSLMQILDFHNIEMV